MELEDMKGAIILLALIALIGSAAAISLDAFKNDIIDDLPSSSVTNETEASLTNTSTVSCTFVSGGESGFANSTGGFYTPIDSGQFSISQTGTVTVLNASIYGNQTLLNYGCYRPSNAYNITGYGEQSLDNSTSYLDTIGTIIGVAVLIGIVVMAFAFAAR